jgi:NAD(P)-dependent dehydrogenase (short-subunit alcohol dehydrogenase family)
MPRGAASIPAAMDPTTSSANFRMDNRVALITGAGRGIGLAMAQTLAAAGCAVAIQDIELDVAEAEVAKLTSAGHRAIALGGDVLDLDLPKRAVAEVVERLGGLHVLINNAAIQQPNYWLDATPAEMERQLRADLVTPILFCQQAVPIFRRQQWGRIINLGSIQQKGGNPKMLAYSLSKAGLERMTMALARDLGAGQITVNLIAPGWIHTHRTRNDFASLADKAEKGKNCAPLGRVGEPTDFAGITLLLCSDAGAYITGQTIYVDGGMSAR